MKSLPVDYGVTSGGAVTSGCEVTSGCAVTSGRSGESLPGDLGLVVMSLPGGLGTSYRILRSDWLLPMTVRKVT